MKFVKDADENRDDYIFQKDQKTVWTTRLFVVVLIILAIAVGVTSFFLNK